MNSVGSRYLLFGGFDGKSTYGDLWWLVPEDDPMAKSSVEAPPKAVLSAHDNTYKRGKDGEELGSAVSALMKRFEISSSPSSVISDLGNAEVAQLASQICKNNDPDILEGDEALQAIRDHWFKSTSETITLKELSLLLRDYKLLVYQQMRTAWSNLETGGDISAGNTFRFHHVKSASQLRMDDVAALLAEYKQLLSSQR